MNSQQLSDVSTAAKAAVEEHRSPYAIAQDGLAELIEASVHAQRLEAMNAAMRIDLIFLTVSHALRCEEAFVAPTLSPEHKREIAHRSVTAELATALHIPERTMERQIADAWSLSTSLPTTLAALRSGAISPQHARVVVEETSDLAEDPGLRSKLDECLAVLASTTTAATVRRKASLLREELQDETRAERHRAARAQRRVEIEPAADGMAWLHALLPAHEALLIKDRLDRIARSAVRAGADHRGVEQIRADAARDLLLYGKLPSGHDLAESLARVRPTVHVTVPCSHSCAPRAQLFSPRCGWWPTVRQTSKGRQSSTDTARSTTRPQAASPRERRRLHVCSRIRSAVRCSMSFEPSIGYPQISSDGSRCETASAVFRAATAARSVARSTTRAIGSTSAQPPMTTSLTSARGTTTSSTSRRGRFGMRAAVCSSGAPPPVARISRIRRNGSRVAPIQLGRPVALVRPA